MSFNTGSLITALGLNALGDAAESLSGSVPGSTVWTANPDNTTYDAVAPNGGVFYSRRPSDYTIFMVYIKCGWFGGVDLYVDKLVNGSWSNIFYYQYGWSTDGYFSVSGTGEGWYRVRSGTAHVDNGYPAIYYWGKIDNWVGGRLRYFDDYTGDGYTVGERLTADILNSGRVGTY